MSKLISPHQNKFIVRNLLTGTNEVFPFTPQNSRSFENAQRRARERERQILAEIEGPLGRELTHQEIVNGFVQPVEDRTPEQIDKNWKPVLKEQRTRLEKIADQFPNHDDSWKRKSRGENIRNDLKNMQQREAEQANNSESKVHHQRQVAEQMSTLDALEQKSKWIEGEPASYREAIRKAKLQLAEPDGDPAVTRELLRNVEQHVEARKQERLASLQQQQEQLDRVFGIIKEQHVSLTKEDVNLVEEPQNLVEKFEELGLSGEGQQRRFADAKKWNESDERALHYAHTGELPEVSGD